MKDDKLLKQIRKYVTDNPGDSGEILQAVANGMADYEQVRKQQRDSLATNAVISLMSMSKFSSFTTIPMIIDIAYHQFPKGLSGHAKCEIDFWEKFIAMANKHGVDWDWLRDIKGWDYVIWWTTYVVPTNFRPPRFGKS